MTRFGLSSLGVLCLLTLAPAAHAVRSAELYTSASYGYGRVEARLRFAGGDGVVGSFFGWKDGSEQPNVFWIELDFEKIGGNCQLATNPLYGLPEKGYSVKHNLPADFCSEYHVFAWEWTPDALAWFVDGQEIRRETGAHAAAFAEHESSGMQIHFNVWPGDATFGGNFDPAILPVHQYIDWVQFSAYENGTFNLKWREDFDGGTVPAGWLTGNWGSPKNLSTHDPSNVNFIDGFAVLSLTADNAVGPAGAMPGDSGGGNGAGGSNGNGAGGDTAAGGAPPGGSAGGSTGDPGTGAGAASAAGGSTGDPGTGSGVGGSTGVGGSAPGAPNGAGGASPGAPGEPGAPGASTSSSSGSCSVGSATSGRPEAWLSLLGVAASLLVRRRKSSSV
jgi:endo-1,3-1,4-beta-glycanase ExoK